MYEVPGRGAVSGSADVNQMFQSRGYCSNEVMMPWKLVSLSNSVTLSQAVSGSQGTGLSIWFSLSTTCTIHHWTLYSDATGFHYFDKILFTINTIDSTHNSSDGGTLTYDPDSLKYLIQEHEVQSLSIITVLYPIMYRSVYKFYSPLHL